MSVLKNKACAASAAAMAFTFAMPAQADEIGDIVPNLFICEMVPGPVSVGYEARQAAADFGGQVVHVYTKIGNGFAISVNGQAIDALVASNPYITGCEPSHIVGLDTESASYATKGPPSGGDKGGGDKGGGGKGGGTAPAQKTDWGVARIGGPVSGTFTHRAYVVDTGVDLDHPDLNVNAGASFSFLSARGRGNDSPDDYNGHGSHVAGVIGALDNEFGIVGVAPGAEIVSIRVLDKNGTAPDADVAAGLEFILSDASGAQAGDVVNLSLVADPGSTVLDPWVKALGDAGLLVVMGAGNGATLTDEVSPAYNEGVNLFTVSAFKIDDIYSFPSNSGDAVDFAEPGENIYSLDKDGGYGYRSGTSMAAPHLSGILLATGGVDGCGYTDPGSGFYVDPDGSGDPIGVVPGTCP